MIKDDTIAKTADFQPLLVSSPAFNEKDYIPSKYTCQGEDISPPLNIDKIPETAKSLALIVDDPDAPAKTWVHCVAWNIPVSSHIEEGGLLGNEGINDFKSPGYGGPCPPSGTHRYFFKVYALDALLELPSTTTKEDLEKAMNGHIVAFGELVGLYQKFR